MGANETKETKEPKEKLGCHESGLSHFEVESLKETTKNFFENNVISEDKFAGLFPNNEDFARNLHTWMRKQSNKDVVDLSSLLNSVAIFLKKSRKWDPLELFILIACADYHIKTQTAAYEHSMSVSKLTEPIRALIKICCPKALEKEVDRAVSAVTSSIEDYEGKEIEFKSAIARLKSLLPLVQRIVENYFFSIFFSPASALAVPELDQSSAILTQELLSLLYLNCNRFNKINKLACLYSMRKRGVSFNRLAEGIKGYSAPTIILLKHIDPDGSVHILGGYSSSEWFDGPDYFGDNDCFLFSLVPKFKIYRVDFQAGGKNYLYFNSRGGGIKKLSSKVRVGIGFGGSKSTKCRLWVDEEMETDCYVHPEDDTYRKGYLTESHISKLNVDEIEVWGLGDESAIKKQEQYRMREQERLEKERKVDRKAFLTTDLDRGILFEKTFQAANNRRDIPPDRYEGDPRTKPYKPFFDNEK